jgi:hypothetical protein
VVEDTGPEEAGAAESEVEEEETLQSQKSPSPAQRRTRSSNSTSSPAKPSTKVSKAPIKTSSASPAKNTPKPSTDAPAPASPAAEDEPRDSEPTDSQDAAPVGSPTPASPDAASAKRKRGEKPVECDFDEWREDWNDNFQWIKERIGTVGSQQKQARKHLDHLCDRLEDTECEHSEQIDIIASALNEINAFAGDAVRIKSAVLTSTLLRRLTLLHANIYAIPAHGKSPRAEAAQNGSAPAAADDSNDE